MKLRIALDSTAIEETGDDLDDLDDRVAKCQIFYTDKNLSSKFYPKNA